MQTHIADMSDTFPIRNYMNQKPLKCLLCGRRVDWQTSKLRTTTLLLKIKPKIA